MYFNYSRLNNPYRTPAQFHRNATTEIQTTTNPFATLYYSSVTNSLQVFLASAPTESNYFLEVYNALGKKIFSCQAKEGSIYNFNDFPAGIYFCHLSNLTENVTVKKITVIK